MSWDIQSPKIQPENIQCQHPGNQGPAIDPHLNSYVQYDNRAVAGLHITSKVMLFLLARVASSEGWNVKEVCGRRLGDSWIPEFMNSMNPSKLQAMWKNTSSSTEDKWHNFWNPV